MKRWCFLFLGVLLSCFVLASVNVDNYDVKDSYVFLDEISGKVNLSIENEYYDENIVLSNNENIKLGDFFLDNGVQFDCFPADCSMGYSALPGDAEKTVAVSPGDEKYLGFVLEGEDVVLEDISFSVNSDFGRSAEKPLTVEFFEGSEWSFFNFSDEFLPKNWGCFNPVNKEIGPLIGDSFYCEMIETADSGMLKIGADIDYRAGQGNLTMSVYPESGFGFSMECSFDPGLSDGCVVGGDEVIIEGKYQVCVGADSLTEYTIYEDNSGENCGFAYDRGPEGSVKDYGIYARSVKYADAQGLERLDLEGKVDEANAFILERYDGNCSEGCVLPLKISGIDQNFGIYNVSLSYTDQAEWRSSNLVHKLEQTSALVSFNGTLDLGLLGIVVTKGGEYFAKILETDLFRENITLLAAPVILSVSPMNPPAGVPVSFYANVDFNKNETLSYEWDFGDGSEKVRTSIPYATHAYSELKNYTLSVSIDFGNLTSKKEFEINTVNPENAVSIGLDAKKNALVEIRSSIEKLSDWYKTDLMKLLRIDFFEGELSRFEREKNNSFDVEDFISVATELYGLNIPTVISRNEFEYPFFMTDLKDVDIEPVAVISGRGSGDSDAYAKAILTWQNQNVDVSIKGKDVFATYWSGEDEHVLSVYLVEVTSRWDRESYFIINKPFDELYFNGDAGARKAGNATAIILGAQESKIIELYSKDKIDSSFFVSPKLGSLVTEEDIAGLCNFNFVCEEEAGENSENCRSDCKPVGRAILFFVLGVLFLVCIYIVLQIWYKRHYENYLFGKDRAQLHNLLMYISNARVRGIDEKDIVKNLKSKGWSVERINYAIRKSLGKPVGMFEIVPIEKFSAWIRDMKAKRAMEKARKAATTKAQGQTNDNINKSGVRF